MSSVYDFDAPQFIDLGEGDDENADGFFNSKFKELVNEVSSSTDPHYLSLIHEKENIQDQENKYPHQKIREEDNEDKNEQNADDEKLWEKIEKLQIDSSKKATPSRRPLRTTQMFDGILLPPTSEKKHRMTTRMDSITRTPLLQLRSRSIPKIIESEDETDDSMISAVSSTSQIAFEPSPLNPKDAGAINLKRTSGHFQSVDDIQARPQPCKFVALAEQVANFHKETPDRYRTKPHNPWRPTMIKPALLGFAKGPSLASLRRTRAIHYPDQHQREQQEYEEMLRHQIKARPVNTKILKEVSLGLKARIEKRPTTCPEPFKLTEYKPKPVEETPVFQFKAQPVPKKILQSPTGIPPRVIKPATTPKTPAIRMPTRARMTPVPAVRPTHCSSESLHRNTTMEPFSFEERDKRTLAKKEETIKKILEADMKTFNSFKAQPIRNFTSKAIGTPQRVEKKKTTTPMPFNLTQIRPNTVVVEEKFEPFHAKPATVLVRKPFFPSHKSHETPKAKPFQLRTITRAIERKKFDEQILETEEKVKQTQEKLMEEREKQMQEEIKKMRKQAEFKANPIPRSQPFEIHASDASLTQPMSPQFFSKKGKDLKN